MQVENRPKPLSAHQLLELAGYTITMEDGKTKLRKGSQYFEYTHAEFAKYSKELKVALIPKLLKESNPTVIKHYPDWRV